MSTKPEKILYIITKANWGGAQRYVFDLATEMQERGTEAVVAYGEPGKLVERLEEAGVRYERIAALARDIGLLKEFSAFWSLLRLIRRERPDIVHINSSKAGLLGALAGRLGGARRIIFTAHGWAFNEARPWWQRKILFFASGLIALFSHETICVSEATRDAIAGFPFIRSKLSVILLGIDTPDFLPRHTVREKLAPGRADGELIGMVSELHPTKCVEDAIRAMRILVRTHPSATLVIIGDGEEREKLSKLVSALNLQEEVRLVGFIPDSARYLRAFDAFLHTPRSEALGYVLLEAGSAGLPVVATQVGGIPEIIPDERFGVLIPSKDPDAAAEALEVILENPAHAERLGLALKERVRERFSKERMFEETQSLYEARWC